MGHLFHVKQPDNDARESVGILDLLILAKKGNIRHGPTLWRI